MARLSGKYPREAFSHLLKPRREFLGDQTAERRLKSSESSRSTKRLGLGFREVPALDARGCSRGRRSPATAGEAGSVSHHSRGRNLPRTLDSLPKRSNPCLPPADVCWGWAVMETRFQDTAVHPSTRPHTSPVDAVPLLSAPYRSASLSSRCPKATGPLPYSVGRHENQGPRTATAIPRPPRRTSRLRGSLTSRRCLSTYGPFQPMVLRLPPHFPAPPPFPPDVPSAPRRPPGRVPRSYPLHR